MLEMQRNIYVLRRWWWLILLAAVVGALVAFGATKALVKQRYQAMAIISVAPAPSGPSGLSVTSLSATADAQLMSTLSTALAARHLLTPEQARQVDAQKLAHATVGTPSLDGQLLSVSVLWPDQPLAPVLANAVARAFVTQERARLRSHYDIIHAVYLGEETSLARLNGRAPTAGPAAAWERAQNAEAARKLYENDADARIQVSLQTASLQLAQPATGLEVTKIGPKASINGLLGGALGALLALVFAFVQTSSYGEADASRQRPAVLTKVGD